MTTMMLDRWSWWCCHWKRLMDRSDLKADILVGTLQLHYNAVLYNAVLYITRSPRRSQLFFQYTMCENVSRWSQYTQCKLWKSYYLCIP